MLARDTSIRWEIHYGDQSKAGDDKVIIEFSSNGRNLLVLKLGTDESLLLASDIYHAAAEAKIDAERTGRSTR